MNNICICVLLLVNRLSDTILLHKARHPCYQEVLQLYWLFPLKEHVYLSTCKWLSGYGILPELSSVKGESSLQMTL